MGTIITLCTDFGLDDSYVAAMKGVILGIAPDATLVDVTHQIAPQNVLQGALVLAGASAYFPPGTVHLAVVDPGVGSPRRAVAVACGTQFFVCPDNGLLSRVLDLSSADARRPADYRAVALTRPPFWRTPDPSPTFHGRDVFAPVAAHLAAGVPLGAFGPDVHDLARLDIPLPSMPDSGRIEGEILYADHFGNLVSNVPAALLAGRADWQTEIGGRAIAGLSHTYTDVRPGVLLSLVGSHGYLEVAQRDGSAAIALQIGNGAPLTLRRPPPLIAES